MTSQRLKHLAKIVAGQAPPGTSVFALDEAPNALPFIQGNAEFGPEHPNPRLVCPSATKVAVRGDVLVSVRAPVGALNIANSAIGIGRGVAAVSARACSLDQRFLWWYMHYATDALQALSSGTTYRAVTTTDIGALKVPHLEIERQREIADFLDRECERIDAAGSAAQHPIDIASRLPVQWLLDAIAQLDRPSERLRFGLQALGQGWSPECWDHERGPGEWGVLKLSCVNGGVFSPDHKTLPPDVSPRPELEVVAGDLLMSRANTRSLVGSAAVVPAGAPPRLMLSDLLYRLRVRCDCWHAPFVAAVLNGPVGRFQIEAAAIGSSGSMPKVSQAVIRDLRLPRPDIADQIAIARGYDACQAEVSRLVVAADRARRGLDGYRDSLIHEAVTGKLDVSQVSEAQMDERLHAAREDRLDEAAA